MQERVDAMQVQMEALMKLVETAAMKEGCLSTEGTEREADREGRHRVVSGNVERMQMDTILSTEPQQAFAAMPADEAAKYMELK